VDTASRDPSESHSAILAPPIAEFEVVHVTHTMDIERSGIPQDASGTVVAVHDRGAAYAVEIADLPGGPEVVTLRAGQIERKNSGAGVAIGTVRRDATWVCCVFSRPHDTVPNHPTPTTLSRAALHHSRRSR
jgi:hypothetical protein